MPQLATILLDPSDARWKAFTASRPQANIFHHPAWIELLTECYGFRPFIVAVRDANDVIRAGLPIMEVDGLLTRRRWISLPFTDHYAPLYDSAEALRSLTDGLIHLSQVQSTPRIELRCELSPYPAIRPSAYVLHTLPLSPDSDSVFCRFRSMHRRNIQTAQKKGVRIELGDQKKQLELFYRLHLQTRRRQGIPVQPWRFFKMLGSNLIEKGLGFVSLAYSNNECLAAAVFLHSKGTLTYKFAASSAEGKRSCSNNLLLWTGIRWGCDNGYTLFDLGKTDLANIGLRAFKSGWGAEETPLNYSILNTESPRNTTAKLLPIVQTVIRHSPTWVCRVLGELLYKQSA